MVQLLCWIDYQSCLLMMMRVLEGPLFCDNKTLLPLGGLFLKDGNVFGFNGH